MNYLRKIFRNKNKSEQLELKEVALPVVAQQTEQQPVVADAWRFQQILSMLDSLVRPTVAGNNFIEMFKTIAEVHWPIDFIARRISEAHFDIKRASDDSLVWCDRMGSRRVIDQPNPLMTWREVVYQHFVYILATGNGFFRSAMPETITADAIKFQWCSNYWSLPADLVSVIPMQYSYGVPMFGIAKIDELIKGYSLNIGEYSDLIIPYWQVWHDRDGLPELLKGNGFLKATSRLMAVKKSIANLLAVYEARNVIYIKRGALGFIVARKKDETGTVALEPQEKADLKDEIQNNYGLTGAKSPFAVTDVPVDFIRTNLSIGELMPLEETLEDAIKIASIYGIPSCLVPRPGNSTYDNQESAEKNVYTSVIIPMAKRFCDAITKFIGLDRKGLYLDCDFSDVACLQVGLKDAEQVRKMVNERCLMQFNNGVITINDWRAQIHEDALEGDIFKKTKFEMTPEELEFIGRIITPGYSTNITFNRGWQERPGKISNNNQPSKEEKNEGTDD